MNVRARVILRLLGVRINEIDDTLVRITLPRRNEKLLPKVIQQVRATAWREGQALAVIKEHDGVTTLRGPGGQRVEIRVV